MDFLRNFNLVKTHKIYIKKLLFDNDVLYGTGD